jgi:hypothetical protein
MPTFDDAWTNTMLRAVGPHWSSAPQFSPGDPDVDNGAIGTSTQRKKTGYTNAPNYPGGETKFGLGQYPNPEIRITTMTYAAAKSLGQTKYWQSTISPCDTIGAYVGVLLFDMNMLHGVYHAREIYLDSGITSLLIDPQATQLVHAQTLYNTWIAFMNTIPRPEYTGSWLARAAADLVYVQGLP